MLRPIMWYHDKNSNEKNLKTFSTGKELLDNYFSDYIDE